MLQPRRNERFFSPLLSNTCGVLIALLLLAVPVLAEPENSHSKVICREKLSVEKRQTLANKLRKITGWPRLGFNAGGALQVGSAEPVGIQSARDLIAKVIHGADVVFVEDASNRTDVVFCRVVLARWKDESLDHPLSHVVLIDFADFEQIMGDRRAREAFNVGWGFLHEIQHIASDSADAKVLGETGECEAHINQMRRECGLPERAEYFFTFFPLNVTSDFKTRFVRLSFVEAVSLNKQKRYWLIWDAALVGGIQNKKEIASLRP